MLLHPCFQLILLFIIMLCLSSALLTLKKQASIYAVDHKTDSEDGEEQEGQDQEKVEFE